MEQIAKEQGAKLIHVPFKDVDGYRMLGFVAPSRRAPEQGFRTRR